MNFYFSLEIFTFSLTRQNVMKLFSQPLEIVIKLELYLNKFLCEKILF